MKKRREVTSSWLVHLAQPYHCLPPKKGFGREHFRHSEGVDLIGKDRALGTKIYWVCPAVTARWSRLLSAINSPKRLAGSDSNVAFVGLRNLVRVLTFDNRKASRPKLLKPWRPSTKVSRRSKERERERQEKWKWGLTRGELENELAGRPTWNQRRRVLTYLRLGDRRPKTHFLRDLPVARAHPGN